MTDWASMTPADFNDRLVPRKHRNAPTGLFPVTDVLPAPALATPAELPATADDDPPALF